MQVLIHKKAQKSSGICTNTSAAQVLSYSIIKLELVEISLYILYCPNEVRLDD